MGFSLSTLVVVVMRTFSCQKDSEKISERHYSIEMICLLLHRNTMCERPECLDGYLLHISF